MESSPEPVSATRQKHDVGWQYCQRFLEGKREHIKCIYCGKMFKGGGIYRFKEHLAGRKGGGPMCQQVPSNVRLLMQQNLDEIVGKQTNKRKMRQEDKSNAALPPPEEDVNAGYFDSPVPIQSSKRKKDVAWEHCQTFKNGPRVEIKCRYCSKLFKGGGIHRFKEHLAGRKGAAPICNQVPYDVRLLMQQILHESQEKQKKNQKLNQEDDNDVSSPPSDAGIFGNHYETGLKTAAACDSVEPNLNILHDDEEGTSNGNMHKKKRERGKVSSANADDAAALYALGSLKTHNPVHMAMGRLFYDVGANLDALNSIHFQRFVDMIAPKGSGFIAPSPLDFQGRLLKSLVEEVKSDIDQYRTTWGKTGCSILVEEWNSEDGKTLLNFLVYCSQGTVFLRSVDVSDTIYSPESLQGLLKEVVEEVGAANVLQVITNGEEHYMAAGKKLMDSFPFLYWAPCAAHCIDMMLEDFGKLEWMNAVIEQAKTVTRFVYNNSAVLNLMRKFTFGNDIVQQAVTRSASNFTTLKQMADFKLNLQTMVTSQEWVDCPHSKQVGGLAMLDVISNRSFWSSCILIIRLTSPLLRVLGIVNAEKRAGMGYVLSGMYQAKESIKRELVKREDYMVYWNIIDHRWKQQNQPPLHAAGFFLNPKFFYSIKGDMHNAIVSRMFDSVERLVPDVEIQDKVVKEINSYKDAVGDLGRKMAIRARETLLPAEWWTAYGGGCPNLARLAIRILSQTCSSIVCKRHHIPFQKLYETKNCLERQRLSDLFFVQYNLRLKQMVEENKNQIPRVPISFENMSTIEDWIMQNELSVEDYGSSDWMSLLPPSGNTMPLGSPPDETEDLVPGFDDDEIFDGWKEGNAE